MDIRELQKLFYSHGIEGNQEVTFDDKYVLPSEDWLMNVFGPAFKRNLKALGLDKWKPNANDCDKFARLAWALASIDHARTSPDSGAGLALGMFGYKRDQGSAHEINVAAVSKKRIVFWEPQNQSIVQLTPQEVSLCLNRII